MLSCIGMGPCDARVTPPWATFAKPPSLPRARQSRVAPPSSPSDLSDAAVCRVMVTETLLGTCGAYRYAHGLNPGLPPAAEDELPASAS